MINIRTACEAAIATCLIIIVCIEYGRPLLADLLYADTYRRLTYECDLAMHEEAALREYPDTQEKALLLVSADVALTVCHDYDKLRKRLKSWGVSEDQLSMYGLEALETETIPVSRMVDPHRMPRF